MSFRTIIVGILAAVCGISATIGVMTLNSNRQAAQPEEVVKVLVAKTDIDLGQQIAPNQLEELEWHS